MPQWVEQCKKFSYGEHSSLALPEQGARSLPPTVKRIKNGGAVFNKVTAMAIPLEEAVMD